MILIESTTKPESICFLFVLQGIDLQGVKAYSTVDPDGLYTLGTVVVDYRGYRVTAQSIIPGKVCPVT